ncbi:NUDIX hydrolase [Umezawaea beigongshangensis]|uniref:NUDIX hydrolase n=1 Tax=Umezawaea beigongshangensis TaxID=2780383 RepID=UPI0018F18512|nr:NUDIX domain-containing protein [Umezawaea beigongshangensis]
MIVRHVVDVHVVLRRADEVLLLRRRDPAPEFDGGWQPPAGKLDAGESVLTAAVREAFEEVGVGIDPADLRLVHTAHARVPGHEPRLGLFFACERWSGEPANREPDKCSEVAWFPLSALPSPLLEYPCSGLAASGPLAVLGWD